MTNIFSRGGGDTAGDTTAAADTPNAFSSIQLMSRAAQSPTIAHQVPDPSTIISLPATKAKAGALQSNLDAADLALNLTPPERALYERHFKNLTGPGGVDNEDGTRSTLYQSTVAHDGKTYNIPTVWDGKILPTDEAVQKVEAEGWDKFPSYDTRAEAEKRYQQMHKFMEQDTTAFMKMREDRLSANSGIRR